MVIDRLRRIAGINNPHCPSITIPVKAKAAPANPTIVITLSTTPKSRTVDLSRPKLSKWFFAFSKRE
jgi:hypothetical protein